MPFDFSLWVTESNHIEGFKRIPTIEEINECKRFLALEKVEVPDMKAFVKVYQPNAYLRTKVGADVTVGEHVPPAGGERIRMHLQSILEIANNNTENPYVVHQMYEHLHPFTDGNGRSGRQLWLWHMYRSGKKRMAEELGFLHSWYYQSLQEYHNVGINKE